MKRLKKARFKIARVTTGTMKPEGCVKISSAEPSEGGSCRWMVPKMNQSIIKSESRNAGMP